MYILFCDKLSTVSPHFLFLPIVYTMYILDAKKKSYHKESLHACLKKIIINTHCHVVIEVKSDRWTNSVHFLVHMHEKRKYFCVIQTNLIYKICRKKVKPKNGLVWNDDVVVNKVLIACSFLWGCLLKCRKQIWLFNATTNIHNCNFDV